MYMPPPSPPHDILRIFLVGTRKRTNPQPSPHQSHHNNSPGYDRYVCFKDTHSSPAAAAGNLPCPSYPHHHPYSHPGTHPLPQHQHHHQATDPRILRHIHYHKHYGSHAPSPGCCGNRYPSPYQDWPQPHGNHHRLPHARCHFSQCTRLVPEGGVGCQGYAMYGGLNGGYGGGHGGYGVGNGNGYGYGGCSGRRVYGPPLPVFVMGVPRRGCR